MTKLDVNSRDSWVRAKKYADLINPIPPVLYSANTTLWCDYLKNGNKPSPGSLAVIKRLDKTAKLKVPLSLAAIEFHEHKPTGEPGEEPAAQILDVLGPSLFSVCLSLTYVNLRIKKISHKEEVLEQYIKEFTQNCELGYVFAESTQFIDPGLGCLLGGIRFAALGAFLLHDPENYMKYRNLKKHSLDLEQEHTRWGCDHGQVASYILGNMGFKYDLYQIAYVLRKMEPENSSLAPELVGWLETLKALDHFIDGKSSLNLQNKANIRQLEKFEKECSEILQHGVQKFQWMLSSAIYN